MASLGSQIQEMLIIVMKELEAITEGHLEDFSTLRQSISMFQQSVPPDSLLSDKERLLLLQIKQLICSLNQIRTAQTFVTSKITG